ncbi:MAG: DUF2794 domain-containing protein [Alphaproteobacteria bacterium]|nr:MAG: DUF2794 domain-containing protein [Alphaproteobacteria bacterium]
MNMMSRSAGKPDRNVRERVTFHRSELNQILQVYGRMVAAGEWKDYGISHLRDAAVFCVFRSATEIPLYRIEKRPGAQARQGMYSVVALDGRVLRRGPDLAGVLRVFERKPIRLVRG